MAEITDDITGDDTVSLVAITADGYGHIPGTNIAAVLGIDQGQSLDPAKGRPAVKTVATTNLTLSGEQTIAGAACVAGDRVLLTAQTAAAANRPYVVASGAWAPAGDSLVSGAWWYATAGNNTGLWQLTTADPIVPGTTDLTIVLRAAGYTAAHASSHAAAGADPVTIAESQVTGLTAALAGKSATGHNHDGSYAATGHNHDSAYAAKAGSIVATYRVYLSSDGSSMAAEGTQTVAFNAELAAVSGFSLSGGEVTLADAAKYEVDAHIEANGTTSNVKIGCPAVLQTDDSGNWATVAGASAYLSEAGASTNPGLQNVRTDIRWPVTTTGSNKKIRIYLGPSVAGTSALVCKGNRCRMTIRKVAA